MDLSKYFWKISENIVRMGSIDPSNILSRLEKDGILLPLKNCTQKEFLGEIEIILKGIDQKNLESISHCNISNPQLAYSTMIAWINSLSKKSNDITYNVTCYKRHSFNKNTNFDRVRLSMDFLSFPVHTESEESNSWCNRLDMEYTLRYPPQDFKNIDKLKGMTI